MARRDRRTPNLTAYAGKWVALANDHVVAVGVSLLEVMHKLSVRPSRRHPSLFLVPRRKEGPYVLVVIPPAC